MSKLTHIQRIVVLTATFNGLRWLPEQIDSILFQKGVDVHLVVSDDMSTDGTWEWLQQLSERESRITLLPQIGKFGGAAPNFFRLLHDVSFSNYGYVCFADQDDIWREDKLYHSLNMIHIKGVDAVSSDVIAFWPDGRERLIRKAQPLRELDHFFESPGPGCTFMIKADAAIKLAELLRNNQNVTKNIALHDWLIYVWARSNGYKWWIDPVPTVRYRQHASNEFGANAGFRAIKWRWDRLLKGWYRNQVLMMARLVGEGDAWPIKRMERLGLLDRLILVASVGKFRRLWRDRLILGLGILLMRKSARDDT